MARTREYEFIVGPETSTLPTSGTPTEDDDVVTLGYAEKHFKQGALAVADVTALKAIAAADRTDKDEVFVESLRRSFHFDSGSSASGDDIYVCTPAAGTGRWLCTNPDPVMETALLGKAISTPANPAASHRKLYPKTDGWYDLDSAGNEVLITPIASDGPSDIKNFSLAASVASNILTIAAKDKSGSDASAGSPIRASFRNATAATGTYTVVSHTSSLSMDVSSTATLGHANGVARFIYVYLINNAGTIELAVSSTLYETGSIVTTTTMSSAADSLTAIYSTTGRTGVALRLVGRLLSSQATAGTWASTMTEITCGDHFANRVAPFWSYEEVSSAFGHTSGVDTQKLTVVNIPRTGLYAISALMEYQTGSTSGNISRMTIELRRAAGAGAFGAGAALGNRGLSYANNSTNGARGAESVWVHWLGMLNANDNIYLSVNAIDENGTGSFGDEQAMIVREIV